MCVRENPYSALLKRRLVTLWRNLKRYRKIQPVSTRTEVYLSRTEERRANTSGLTAIGQHPTWPGRIDPGCVPPLVALHQEMAVRLVLEPCHRFRVSPP